ncbi:hypothetical protein [Zhihengliuella sp.]|uniref:hypothetical protein n=1 Tax=Zhihengliuella sp. TaxID=1954483 RepID=UPI0028128BDE|nr:hypothetical protein [Zhihengliuella sp.]
MTASPSNRRPEPSRSEDPPAPGGRPSGRWAWPRLPGTLRAAAAWWGVLAAALLVFALAAFANHRLLAGEADRSALVILGIFLCGLAAVIGWGTVLLLRGRLSGRAQLTTFGLIAGLPLLFRGPRLMIPAVGLLIGVLLLWLPPSLRYFKAQAKAARAARRREKDRLKGR